MNRASARADQLRRMREAQEIAMQSHSEEEQRQAARYLGVEHFLPEPQESLPLQQQVA